MEGFDRALREKVLKALGIAPEHCKAVKFGCAPDSGFVSSDYAATSPITGFRLATGQLQIEVALKEFVDGNLQHLAFEEDSQRWVAVVDYPAKDYPAVSFRKRYPVDLSLL